VPKYGGSATQIVTILGQQFDPWMFFGAHWYMYEQLFQWDWHIDRDVWAFKAEGAPMDCFTGLLADTWEWEDPKTLVVNLKQGVKWHNRAPTNGRELTADDVVWHYDRQLGTGSGFTQLNPFTGPMLDAVVNVTKRDKYTIAVNFKEPTPLANWWAITAPQCANMMEPPETVEVDNTDYNYCSGTGAFMVTDFIIGNSLTLSRNPDYHQFDTAYPDNRLPYLDELKLLYIVDRSTQIAALRSGQADILYGLDWQTADSMKKTNPEIVINSFPVMGMTMDFRLDKEPFTDIRVRKAMQMAINIPLIAERHFGGYVSSDPPNMLADVYKGWTRPYAEWPEDIKKEYVYDPDQAKKLLADAGYPNGFDTNCYAQTTDDLDLVQILQAFWAEIGVDMEINVMDRPQFIPFVQAGKHDQMRVNFFCNMIFQVDHAYGDRTSTESMNNIYAPAEEAAVYDDLFAQFLAAPDEATAQQLGIQMQDYCYQQHWFVLGPGRETFVANQPRLKGYAGESTASFPETWVWKHWWIDEG
jgi:ABC-type transport system substrate-binding protein